jgi:hypothetical protein
VSPTWPGLGSCSASPGPKTSKPASFSGPIRRSPACVGGPALRVTEAHWGPRPPDSSWPTPSTSCALHRVDLRVIAYNTSAIACYRKCGFVEEGRERETVLVEDRWQDDVLMSLLEDEYQALAPAWAGE